MEYRFTLTYSGTDTEVIEPKGWSEFKSEIKRDFKSHGVLFKFTSGTLKLGFAGEGRTILEMAFQNDGIDAIVSLEVERRDDEFDSYTSIFIGKAIMSNRELDSNYFQVDFEQSTFQQTVINRADTPVKFDSSLDLNGNSVVGSITEQSGGWNYIRLSDRYITNYKFGGDSSSFSTFSGTSGADPTEADLYSELNFDGVVFDQLKEFNSVTEQTTEVLPVIENFVCGISGTLTFTGSIKYRLQATATLDLALSNVRITHSLRVRHLSQTGTLKSDTALITATQSASSPLSYDSTLDTDTFSTTLTVVGSDKLILYWQIKGEPTSINAGDEVTLELDSLDLYDSSQITYSILRNAGSQVVKSYLIYDALEWAMYLITGERDKVYSYFLGTTSNGYSVDGCGSQNVITNGYKLRGLTDTHISVSLNEILKSLQAIYGIGWGFEKQYDGSYKLRVELIEHFYSDKLIYDFSNGYKLESYKESTFNDLVFNKVEIGYKKFADDEDFDKTREDFLTSTIYSTPTSTEKGTYSKLSSFIASGRLIQSTFEQTDDTKSWKHDSSIFFVAVVDSFGILIPENNENFSTVNGVDDADTEYNIRHAPVYMFLNNALVVNSSLMRKPFSSNFINVDTKINQSFEAQFDSGENCLLGDTQRLLRSSVGDIELSNNYVGLRLFNPINHEFEIGLTQSQLDNIVEEMESDEAGYLRYLDNDSNIKEGYVINIKWNQNKNIAEIETIEKADDYAV
ncbi:MAG: hypothetical protein JXQ96_23310 [Cyclobacteriaceae bacterium]